MKIRSMTLACAFLASCAADTPVEPAQDPMQGYEEVAATTVLNAPEPIPGSFAPENLFQVKRGEYLVELLGCGSCHTDGALEGVPNFDRALAGSSIGIAFSNPMGDRRPGIVFPPNLTPDQETGLGSWSDQQIADALRLGAGRHTGRRIVIMPWQGYNKMTDDDVAAIVAYLRSIKPVRHTVPEEVLPGRSTDKPFVYFGVYRTRDND
ncbi:MAG: cytochrome c [Woeseiaceae bacterium]|nr:cytochrome c [Woeseiaceae bacterium]